MAGACSSEPTTAIGTIGAAGLEREPHEAVSEVLQLVALPDELVHAPDALGEGDDALVRLEQVDAVLARAHDRPGAHHRDVDPGDRRQPVLAHAADDARRLGLEHHRRADHRRVEGDLPGVVADQQHAPVREAVDAVRLDAEPVAIEERAS